MNAAERQAAAERRQEARRAYDDLVGEAKFDWYQFTLPGPDGTSKCEPGDNADREAMKLGVKWALSEGLHPLASRKGKNGYLSARPFALAAGMKDPVVTISGVSPLGIMPNLMITGGEGTCARLAASAQQAFPGSRLSRADVFMDMSRAGLFDDLYEMALRLTASNSKLGSVRLIQSETGSTFYLGSPTSTVSLRVYQKDLERAARGVKDREEADPDLTRIEWTFRPQSRSKSGMSVLSPEEMIRTSVWARSFMSSAAALLADVDERYGPKLKKQPVEREVQHKTLEGSARHGLNQYGKTFASLAAMRIVARRFGGQFHLATVSKEEIEAEAITVFGDLLKETFSAMGAIKSERLGGSYTEDQWHDELVDELIRRAHDDVLANHWAFRTMTDVLAEVINSDELNVPADTRASAMAVLSEETSVEVDLSAL